MTPNSFEEIPGLPMTDEAILALKEDGIDTPTGAQLNAIEAILAGKHVLIHAGTGTGKTLAYLLPILQKLKEGGRAVVVAPGAELVMQTFRVANRYKEASLNTGAAIATSNRKRQKKRIQKSTQLVIGTTDRLVDMFKGGKLKGVGIIVLDEIEPILKSRSGKFLYELLSRSEPKVQLIIATATLGSTSAEFIQRFMADGVRVLAETTPLLDAISHHQVPVRADKGKEVALARFIQAQHCKQAIIFSSDPRQQSYLFHFLEEHNISTATLNRDRSKAQRQGALDAFRNGKVRMLLTTDSEARGIDVPNVEWIIHYDLPQSPQAYVHRAGRTGRAGEKGHSVVMVDYRAQGTLRRISKALGIRFAVFKES